MKLVSTNEKLSLWTDHQGKPVSIRKSVSKDTDVSGLQTVWNLGNLVNIVTHDSLLDDEVRVDAEYKRDIAMNMLLGAATGGLIDGMVGSDTIIDGVLIGTAFGAIATNKRKAVAQIGLIFADNESIAVEVDKQQYNILQTFCIENLKKIQDKQEFEPTLQKVEYNDNELDTVGSARKTMKILMSIVMVAGIGFYFLTNNFLFGTFSSNNVGNGSLGEQANQAMINVMPVVFLVLITGLLLKTVFDSTRKNSDFIHEKNKK